LRGGFGGLFPGDGVAAGSDGSSASGTRGLPWRRLSTEAVTCCHNARSSALMDGREGRFGGLPPPAAFIAFQTPEARLRARSV
jgi:hypothetical protein